MLASIILGVFAYFFTLVGYFGSFPL